MQLPKHLQQQTPVQPYEGLYCKARLDHLVAELKASDLAACVITKTSDIRYLTGFENVFDEEHAHLLLVAKSGAGKISCAELYTDKRYSEALRERNSLGLWRIIDDKTPRFAHVAARLKDVFAGRADDDLAPADAATRTTDHTVRVAIESDLRLDWFRALEQALQDEAAQTPHIKDFFEYEAQNADSHECNIELVEHRDLIMQLRAVKDDEEIACLQRAQAITDAAFEHMLDVLKPGITEAAAARELEFFMRGAGADALAFPSIVAFGTNSAIPHAKPSSKVLGKGDLVLMDFGARLKDYCSDMTRTVVMGTATVDQRRMYAAVLAAKTAVTLALKPGVASEDMQKLADEVIAAHGYSGRMIHSLGHGVGIDIHELPVLATNVKTALEVGNVVTVEPGIYIEGVGGVRIEDFGVITQDGFESFTQSSDELIEL